MAFYEICILRWLVGGTFGRRRMIAVVAVVVVVV
jgi:hypothetical protein